MDYNLGTARGVIEIDSRPAERGAKKADDAVSKVGKTSAAANEKVQKLGTGMGVASAGIVAGFALAVNKAADFEHQISAIGAVSGASASEIDAMRKKALQLGADTVFSASEAASAMEELVKAGISTKEVLGGAADAAVALAAAGGVSIPEAATLAADAMNSFQMTAKELPKVVDAIAGAANASSIDVGELAQSLKQVGAVAHLAGQSFDDVAAGIAIMGQAGIKGSDAGTSLKTMLMNLQPMTDKQTSLFKELGIITKDGANQFFDATGKAKSLAQISEVLSRALSGMTQQQKLAALEIMFGSDAIRAAAVLSQAGAKGFEDMSASMKKVSAADVAKKRMGNFQGTLESLKGSVETMAITFGSILLPVLDKVAKFFVKLVNAFQSLPKGAQEVIINALAFIAVALGVAATIIKVSKAINTFKQAMDVLKLADRLKSALDAIRNSTILQAAASKVAAAAQWLLNAAMSANPIMLVVIAIVALIAIFVIAYNKSETFRKIVQAGFNAVLGAAQAVWNWLKKNWPLLLAILAGPFGLAVLAIVKNWDKIKAGATAVVNWVRDKWNSIVNFFQEMPGKISKAASGMWDGIKNAFKGVVNTIIRWWNNLDFKLPKVHVPGTNFDVGGFTLGTPDIPYLARGGVAYGPALIGEGFPKKGEAAVPLEGRGAQLVAAALAREIAAMDLGGDGPGLVIEEHIHNPLPETKSDTTARRLSTMAALGGFGRAVPGRPIVNSELVGAGV